LFILKLPQKYFVSKFTTTKNITSNSFKNTETPAYGTRFFSKPNLATGGRYCIGSLAANKANKFGGRNAVMFFFNLENKYNSTTIEVLLQKAHESIRTSVTTLYQHTAYHVPQTQKIGRYNFVVRVCSKPSRIVQKGVMIHYAANKKKIHY
jgi:hypothetical protein